MEVDCSVKSSLHHLSCNLLGKFTIFTECVYILACGPAPPPHFFHVSLRVAKLGKLTTFGLAFDQTMKGLNCRPCRSVTISYKWSFSETARVLNCVKYHCCEKGAEEFYVLISRN